MSIESRKDPIGDFIGGMIIVVLVTILVIGFIYRCDRKYKLNHNYTLVEESR